MNFLLRIFVKHRPDKDQRRSDGGPAGICEYPFPLSKRLFLNRWGQTSEQIEEALACGSWGRELETGTSCMVTDDEANQTEGTGELCQVKTLYEGPPKCFCCINWVEEKPDDIKPPVEDDKESKRHALLIRITRNHGEGNRLGLHSIVVQSSHLKSVLGYLFQEYEGITTTLKKLVFKAPFHPFYFEWARLEQMACSEENAIRKNHILLLQSILGRELKETIATSMDFDKNGVITFEYLWTIFKPGIDIYAKEEGHDCFYRLVNVKWVSEPRCFELQANQIEHDHDGEFGYRMRSLRIYKFDGTKLVTNLEVIPASCLPLPDMNRLKEKASERGKLFREVNTKDYHYATYQGIAIFKNFTRMVSLNAVLKPGNLTALNKRITYQIDERIVIDSSAYKSHHKDGSVSLQPLKPQPPRPKLDVSDPKHNSYAYDESSPPIRTRQRQKEVGPVSQSFRYLLTKSDETEEEGRCTELSDDLLYLCSPTLRGYSLKTKKWAIFYVDFLQPIKWNDRAFDALVLERDHKRVITTFVESHLANKGVFDDVIKGKGRGLIMLLEGPPGVGKTLTAEAVADKVQQPLYAISAGELGLHSTSVEKSLETALELATSWGAVLLLDESDVFLEKRSSDNLIQNSIVAIFLRLLEYYEGILFLTTNRVKAIDPAFHSRVHLTIQYPPLQANARRQIWNDLTRNSHNLPYLSEKDLNELEKIEVNGREIKNLVKAAQLLATHRKSPLAIEDIRTVIKVTQLNRGGTNVAGWWKRLFEY
ncbi:hypothetical protein O1611_g3284 [Lasiodiplodia mahajangana]|uniref:Uncharacterized protein n=1 Tax=Lasiodiplodia mahajangana TaxID=1108764 RepID=A0ACC2JSL4_9PEZI|nr:hypothetical protein O1611_g3284 [Lasiodiplodia mahajangana]